MRWKTLLLSILLAAVHGGTAFAQTVQLTGTVVSATRAQIVLRSGNDTWTIARTAATSLDGGSLIAGQTVTIQCAAPDAHKNENPSLTPPPAKQ